MHLSISNAWPMYNYIAIYAMPYILIVSTVMVFPSLAAADHDEAGTTTTNSSKRSILGKKAILF